MYENIKYLDDNNLFGTLINVKKLAGCALHWKGKLLREKVSKSGQTNRPTS